MRVEVKPPYDLTEAEVVLDPASESFHLSEFTSVQLLRWFLDTGAMESELERVFRSTVLLQAVTNAPFRKCLDTAMIWERG